MCNPHGQATYNHTEKEQSCNKQSSKAQVYHPCPHTSQMRTWESRWMQQGWHAQRWSR